MNWGRRGPSRASRGRGRPACADVPVGGRCPFRGPFPVGGIGEEAWVATTFALGSDPASPDGDGAVYEATDPGSLKSAKTEATFVDAYPLVLTAMVRMCDPVSSWASTQVGFASDGGREFFVQCHGHVPNLFQLFRSVSGPELITRSTRRARLPCLPGTGWNSAWN